MRRSLIAARDGWRCHCCGAAVDPALVFPHPKSASLDHLVAIAEGGAHEPSNVALAHLRCNLDRRYRAAA